MNELDSDELQEEALAWFADVILPLPLPQLFTYRVPISMEAEVKPGMRVIVQFGPKRVLTAVVFKLHNTPPKVYEAKSILDVLDDSPVVTAHQFQLFQWVAEYYMCTVGEVLQAALPSGLKLSSESRIQLNPAYQGSYEFTSDEHKILEELKRNALSYSEVSQILEKKTILPIVKSLLHKDAILIYEEVKEKYSPKILRKIRLTESFQSPESLEQLLGDLEKKPKQQEVILAYLTLCPLSNRDIQKSGILKSSLIQKGISASSLQTLVRENVFEEFEEIVSRFNDIPSNLVQGFTLSDTQAQKRDEILSHFENEKTVLLHGVTGSGKTEIYMDLIRRALDGGSQVLLLLPEIALTTQMVQRFRKEFGSTMGVYHSRYSDNERVEVWRSILSGKYSFIVGVRSSVFLPFDNLGLILIDEEHESSYKQYEPAPRYHARDTAIVLAGFHHARVLLGSATPSVESYNNTEIGRWARVEMMERYGDAQMPLIELIDLKKERKNKTMHHDFPERVLDFIRDRTDKKEQVILFQNRRGYSPYLSCELCGYVPKCEQCSVSLTYHMRTGELRCHYCGFNRKTYKECPACGSVKIKTVGFGTEKLEDDLNVLMRDLTVQRMDLDTTRQKNSYQTIIEEFQSGKTQVLIGTQMVTKGLDFEKVTLVAIFDIDRMLFFPDFRSMERTFQVLVQVSGRAGRRGKRGLVMVQTNKPESPVFQWVMNLDYKTFFKVELSERKRFLYPPFVRLIAITVKDPDQCIAADVAQLLVGMLRKDLGANRVLGPESPVIDRVRNFYLMQIMIKLDREKLNIPKVKQFIHTTSQHLLMREKRFKRTQIICDVDPI
jgi:primosomal protein N' (replication factor Y)